jgi:hypothetical protein
MLRDEMKGKKEEEQGKERRAAHFFGRVAQVSSRLDNPAGTSNLPCAMTVLQRFQASIDRTFHSAGD